MGAAAAPSAAGSTSIAAAPSAAGSPSAAAAASCIGRCATSAACTRETAASTSTEHASAVVIPAAIWAHHSLKPAPSSTSIPCLFANAAPM